MVRYLTRRVLYMLVVLVAVSLITFLILEAAPGDYVQRYVAQLSVQGIQLEEHEIVALREQYGIDRPIHGRYLTWASNLVRGRMGFSFARMEPVTKLIAERLPYTVILSLGSLLFVYVVAFAIGVYSATHRHTFGDYTFTVLGFVGLATPNFMLALVLMWVAFKLFDTSIGGLFSIELRDAPWSIAKVWDLLRHLVVPVIVVGTAGTAGMIRIVRSSLGDELSKQYVVTARAKGVPERRLLFRYPIRISVNPLVSTVGFVLPGIFSGEAITAVVLGLPTIGPLLLNALLNEDTYLAGSILMVLTALTVIGILISDILLVIVDPRIRLEK